MDSIIGYFKGETETPDDETSEQQNDEGFDFTVEPHNDRILLTHEPLDEKEALSHVRDNGAGATCLFVGTTRDVFQGKAVEQLQYMAYSALARKMMTRLVADVRSGTKAELKKAAIPVAAGAEQSASAQAANGSAAADTSLQDVKRVYVAHRLGDVPVGEPSILVCVSSPHRRAAFEVCSAILEEVKRQVPIWKKEVYAGAHAGTSEWKANAA